MCRLVRHREVIAAPFLIDAPTLIGLLQCRPQPVEGSNAVAEEIEFAVESVEGRDRQVFGEHGDGIILGESATGARREHIIAESTIQRVEAGAADERVIPLLA